MKKVFGIIFTILLLFICYQGILDDIKNGSPVFKFTMLILCTLIYSKLLNNKK